MILHCLREYPEGLSPKLISAKTGLNSNTIKSLLPKMRDVKKIHRGLYKVVNRGDGTLSSGGDLLDWNFHNLILNGSGCRLNAPQGASDFGLVSLDVQGDVVRVSSDWPLNVSSICVIAGLLFKDWKSVMVSSVEFNKDYRNLRLDGVKSVSVDGLVSQFKVYQKRRGMRVEHKTKVPLEVETLVDMLSSQPDTLDLQEKVSRQEQALRRLTAALRANTEMIYKLSEVKG